MNNFVLLGWDVFGLPKRWFLDVLCYKRLTKVTKNIAPTKNSLYFCR